MSKEKQIDEMIVTVKNAVADNAVIDVNEDIITLNGNDLDHAAEQTAEALYNAVYRKQSEVELRVETTTGDFGNLEVAKEFGCYRKKFYCPNCDLLIKTETWDSKRMFGNSTVLKTNEMPNFCPNCGAKMKGE